MEPNTAARAGGGHLIVHRIVQRVGQHPGTDLCKTHIPAINGLRPGTLVLTMDGELPVEYLGTGDRIITRDSGVAKLTRIERQVLAGPMVRICAGGLGHMRPGSDMVLPAQAEVLLRDWRAQSLYGRAQALARAGDLVDGEFVVDLGVMPGPLLSLVFDAPHIVYAGGLELASSVAQNAHA